MNPTPTIQPHSPFLQAEPVACKHDLAKSQLVLTQMRERIKAKLGRQPKRSRKTLP